MRAKKQVVVDCGAAHVSVAVFSVCGGGEREPMGEVRLEAYGREDFVSAPSRSAAWPAQIAVALGAVLSRLRIREGTECRLCLPGHLVLSKRVTTPAVAVEKRAEVLRFEAAQHIPFALGKVAWAALEVGHDGGELDLLLAAAKLDALEPLCAAVESVGLIPCACETTSLALWRALTLAPPADASATSFLVDVGARSTQVVLRSPKSGAVALRTIALGGNSLTASIAQELGLDFADAEALKLRGVDSGNSSAAASASPKSAVVPKLAAEFSAKLAAELTLTRLAYLRQSGGESPTCIHLCGGGSLLPGLHEKIGEALGLPVFEFPIPAALQATSSASANEGSAPSSDLLALYGCAAGACLPESQQLDLLPLPRRVRSVFRRRRPWYLAAAAALALAPVPFLISQRAAIVQTRAQAAAVDAATAPLLRLSASNAEAEARLLGLQNRLAQVRALNAERTRWLGFLSDLQTRLTEVGDVWLERLHYAASVAEAASGDSSAGAARVEIGGWLLESRGADEAMQRLFERLQSSSFVQGINRERYDRSRPGVIRFDAELLINPDTPL